MACVKYGHPFRGRPRGGPGASQIRWHYKIIPLIVPFILRLCAFVWYLCEIYCIGSSNELFSINFAVIRYMNYKQFAEDINKAAE
jgi:hypothetical protein